MMIEVSTSDYEFAHGKKPQRGEDGTWTFFVGSIPEPILISGSYAQAKRVALEYAKARGARRIAVGS